MAVNTKIEWADHTFNPWIGCTKVGPGCDHCYAETLATSRLGVAWGADADRRRTAASTWAQVRAWDRKAAKFGIRYRVFCASLADVFDNAVPVEWRADLFALIRETPNLDWLLVTKRIGNAAKMAGAAGGWLTNVWLGATIVNQNEADRDVPKLLATAGPRFRFLSMEPLLGSVNLTRLAVGHSGTLSAMTGRWASWPIVERGGVPMLVQAESLPAIDWIIVGGESGPGARPMHPDWARSLRDQCAAADVPFLFKQWGEWAPHTVQPGGDLGGDVRAGRVDCVHPSGRDAGELLDDTGRSSEPGSRYMARVGKKAAGRLLDDATHDAVPA